MHILRRTFAVALLFAGLGLACAQGGDDFDWRKFEGAKIRFISNNQPIGTLIEQLIPEFEAATGIDVTLEVIPESQYRNRRLLEVSSGADTLDGYMIMPGQVGAQYLGANWVRNLDDFLADPSLTNADLGIDDFFAGALNTFKTADGHTYGLPTQIETSLLYYRKDLLSAAGITGPPTTMDELEQDAAALNRDGVVGLSMRGQGAGATSQIINFVFSFGGTWLDDEGKCALNDQAGRDALEYYAGVLRESGPPGAVNMHWAEVTSLFSQGQAAMIFDANVFLSIMQDAEQTIDVVRENVGYAPIPAGPGGQVPTVLVWGMAINHASKNPEAMWYFIQWMTNKENQIRAARAGIPAARASAWQDPEFRSRAPNDWIEASQTSFAKGSPQWNPPVLPVAPPEPLPINLRNVAAVRSAVAAAALSFALLLLAGPLGFVALFGAGFFAVYLYHRRTGQQLSMMSGARLGVIAGTFIFLIALALAASASLMSDPGTFDELRQELIKRSAQPEAEVRQALEYIQTPAGMILLASFFYLFFTSLPAFGGALGAKFLDRH